MTEPVFRLPLRSMLLVLLVLVTGCHGENEPSNKGKPPPMVQVATVRLATVTDQLHLTERSSHTLGADDVIRGGARDRLFRAGRGRG